MKKTLLILLFSFSFLAYCQAETAIERKFSLGGWVATGNTEGGSLHADFYLNRNRKWFDETTLKGSFDHESSAGVETMFKISSVLRYGRSFNKKLYHFYQLELEHDRIADIDLRFIPVVGLGYWFYEEEEFKNLGEVAVGCQRDYRVSNGDGEVIVFILRSYIKWWTLINDLSCYAAAEDFDNYRIVNKLNYKLKFNSYYSFKATLNTEYNNQPAAGVKKDDLYFTIGLEYAYKEVRD